MFNLFQKKPVGSSITIKISGLNCSSCSLTIDNELEDIAGVIESSTSYVKQETRVTYDPARVDPIQIKEAVEGLGYQVLSE